MKPINVGALSRRDLSLLVVFDVLARTGSVTLAAKNLSMSQPAVSHALSKLRQMFGDTLFVRSGNGMELTPTAESLADQVRLLISGAESILQLTPLDHDPCPVAAARPDRLLGIVQPAAECGLEALDLG